MIQSWRIKTSTGFVVLCIIWNGWSTLLLSISVLEDMAADGIFPLIFLKGFFNCSVSEVISQIPGMSNGWPWTTPLFLYRFATGTSVINGYYRGGYYCNYYPDALSFKSSHCNSCKDLAPVDFIFKTSCELQRLHNPIHQVTYTSFVSIISNENIRIGGVKRTISLQCCYFFPITHIRHCLISLYG